MQYSCFDFFCFTNVPEIFAQITAGSSRYIHFCVVFVVARGAFPLVIIVDNDFAVKAANVTVVTLGIKLCILNVIVDKLDNFFYCLFVVAHVRDFYIRNRSAGGNLLELTLKLKLGKRIDILAHVNVIQFV